MNTPQAQSAHEDLAPIQVLATLLERLEHSAVAVDPQQYRTLADRLASALRAAKPGDRLGALLAAHPAAAEMYENMHYHVAGLCRSPLESSLAAEMQATEIIQRAMRSPKESSANGQS